MKTGFIKPGTNTPVDDEEATTTLAYYMAALGTIVADAGGELRIPRASLEQYLEIYERGIAASFEAGDLVIRFAAPSSTIH
jgi:hypothetical protein